MHTANYTHQLLHHQRHKPPASLLCLVVSSQHFAISKGAWEGSLQALSFSIQVNVSSALEGLWKLLIWRILLLSSHVPFQPLCQSSRKSLNKLICCQATHFCLSTRLIASGGIFLFLQ